MNNYNLAKTEEVKNALALRLEVLNNEKKALTFLDNCLKQFTRKNLDKHFKDFLEGLSPKYSNVWQEYNRETQKEEPVTKNWPVYSLGIYTDKILFNSVKLYLHDNQAINGAENYLSFTFYPNYNLATEEEKQEGRKITLDNLKKIVARDIENNAATIEKVQKDFDNIETLTAKYNETRTAYDDLLDSLHYYTRDQLTGKRDYNLYKNK